ncbi:hypothetical protein LUZ60_005474 [Juncus effusus]|nr:hypothetical protein LUZ60_005474 [Juncus effusus]
MATKPSVFFLPIYAAGHLIPMIEAAKLLLQCNDSISINFLLMQPPNPESNSRLCDSYLESLQTENKLPIHFHRLPFVEPPFLSEDPEEYMSLYVRLYLPHIKAALSACPSVSGIILDMFASHVIDIANKLNIPSYVYFASNAAFLNLLLHLPTIEKKIKVDFSELDGEISVPGIAPIPALSMVDPLMSKKSASYKWFLYHGRQYTEAKGIIVNSNIHIEIKAVNALSRLAPEIYPVGPIIMTQENESLDRHVCLKWLDTQPEKSVIFLCFGSWGAFEASQLEQMANGLEKSGHRFLWIVRRPSKVLFRPPTDANLNDVLPEGFLERTKKRGLVWPSWVPQMEILSHKSIGGFVTHGGWNSCLESLWCGVPMIPWPLYAEQHLNAFEMVNEMGVAVDLKVDRINDGFVTAEELERAIVCLMGDSEEGTIVRAKVEQVKTSCLKCVEKGGSSYAHWQKLADQMNKVSYN